MFLMLCAGRKNIPATVSITADTGWENDCLLSTGERVTAKQYYNDVIEPLGNDIGIKTKFVRSTDKNGNPLEPLGERMRAGVIAGVPTYGSNGGQLIQGCTEKYKIRGIRQELRRMGATSARSALGLTMDEVHRIKQHKDVKWHSVWWPLITEFHFYKVTIREKLEKMGVPFMLSSECDGCPHKNWIRWQRTSKEIIDDLASIESGLGGTQFLTNKRKPLLEALEDMKNERPSETLFDGCDIGYCFTG